MKTIKLLSTITAVAYVALATAVEKPKMFVIPLEADKAIVSMSNENHAIFEISVSDLNGNVIYYKQTNKETTDYQKIFDFTSLENGSYEIALKVNDTRMKRKFDIKNESIEVGNVVTTFDPFFTFKDDVLKVSYLNFDQSKTSLNIYNNGDLIYESSLGRNFTISKGFDLSSLAGGSYEVVLAKAKNSFTFNIEK